MLPNYRYKGRHRAPSSAGETAVKVAAAGAVAALPVVAAPAAQAAPDHVWDKLAECESSGDWAINTGNGYYGGVQFAPSTWRGFDGTEFAPMAHQATREEQIVVAERVLEVQGWNAWPACSRKLGIRGHEATQRSAPTVAEPPKPEPAPQTSPDRGAPARPAAGDTLTVKAGDTLGELASAHDITWRALFDANRDVVEDADLIFPGERLVLP